MAAVVGRQWVLGACLLSLLASGCSSGSKASSPPLAPAAAQRGETERELVPGETVRLDNGLTVTVPSDTPTGAASWGYSHWNRGADSYRRSDHLSGSFGYLKFISVYDPRALPDYPYIGGGERLVAKSREITVYRAGRGSNYMFSMVTNIPGHEHGFILGGDASGDSVLALRRFWAKYKITGAAMPPPVGRR